MAGSLNPSIVSSSNESDSDEDTVAPSLGKSRDPVWEHYERYTDTVGKKWSKCLTKKPGKSCPPLSGWWPGNAKRHLKTCHGDVYRKKQKEWKLMKEKRQNETKKDCPQQTKLFSVCSSKYSANHPKQKAGVQQLAKAFIENSLPTRLIENDAFRAALTILDEKFSVPSAYLLQQQAGLLLELMKKNILLSLENATKVSITADIWTKRGFTESFMGVTAHWFERNSHKRMAAALAVRKICGRHTASLVADAIKDVLVSWSIPHSKVSRVVTDNGSNMVAAFQDLFEFVEYQEQSSYDNVDDNLDEPDVFIDADLTTFPGDWRLDASFIESDDATINSEITHFDEEEESINQSFRYLKRLSCFAHSLQCAVRILDKSKFACSSRSEAFKLIQSFAHSTMATQLLVEKAGKKLLAGCRTRWSYTYLALQRLIELRPAIDDITREQRSIDNLTNSQWSDILRYVQLMKPLADATYWLEGDKYTTLSEVVPQLIELNCHLDEMSAKYGFTVATRNLRQELDNRFAYITKPSNAQFEPIYVVATALDPRYKVLLVEDQATAAKSEILHLLGATPIPSANVDEPCWNASHSQCQDLGRFKHIHALIQQREVRQTQAQIDHDPLADEVRCYLAMPRHLPYNEDPLIFWKDNAMKYPQLSVLAQDILCIPATSAPVERLFSQASIACGGKRNRLSGFSLEREVMLKANKAFFC